MKYLSRVVVLTWGVLASLGALAQDYPAKPLRFIVPYPAGGPTDVVSRAVAAELAHELGQPVVVENVSGAGGSIGSAAIARAEPDGYTIGLATTGTHAINPHLYGDKLPYDALRDFTPISQVISYVNVLVVNNNVPVRSVAELVSYARQHPDRVNFASSGSGSTNHLSGVLLTQLTGAQMAHIPFRGGAPALASVVGGQVTCMFDLLVSSVPQIQAGKLRALAVTSSKRSAFLPDVPTMDEAGVQGYARAGSDLWFGVVGPAHMPAAITKRLNAEIVKIMNTPAMQQRFSAMYLEARTNSPAQFAEMLAADNEKWGRLVRESGARVD